MSNKFQYCSKTFIVFFSLLVFTAFNSYSQPTEHRNIMLINEGWKFTDKPAVDPFKKKYDDSKWYNINLPHCWNTTDPYEDDNEYLRGICWYRKKIAFPSSYNNKKIFIAFDGANQVADLYVNGMNVGRHKGGYTAFTFDITPFVKPDGSDNCIAVQVSNAHDMFIPPLDVGYTIYGGIYRSVRLIITDKVHFETGNYGSSGVFVSTPLVSKEKANVEVKGSVKNETEENKVIEIKNTLYDFKSNVVASFGKSIQVQPGSSVNFDCNSDVLSRPMLWAPETPYLYLLTTTIFENGTPKDQVTNQVGFRWFRFDADSGFFLNGNNYVLKGTNRHQDYMGKGSALTYMDHETDLKIIKNMGCNFLRLAHYPQDPYVLKRANELGLLLWEEIPLVNLMNINEEFLSNCSHMIKEMIRQHYNNPSVIMWGSMNEIFLHDNYNERAQKITDSAYGVNVRKYAIILDSLVRAEDPTRSSTMAMHMSSDYDKFKIDMIPQVAGYNIYNGWYSGKVEEFGKAFDKKHEAKPNQIILVSEYGAESDLALNTETPTRLDNTGQYQRYFHESYLKQIKERPYFAGTAIWNQFDFGNPNIGGTISNINHKGMFTWDRKPKDVYYFYKANWNPEPLVYIATRDWSHRAGSVNDSSTIEVYSNAPEVTLFVNGKNYGSKKVDAIKKAIWKVKLSESAKVFSSSNGTTSFSPNLIVAKAKFGKAKTLTDSTSIVYECYDSFLNAIAPTSTSLNINVGSIAQYLDNQEKVWLDDRPYHKGSFGYIDGKPSFISLKGKIKNTNKQQLLYTYLEEVTKYKIDLPKGLYEVELFFAEPEITEAGKRVFDVSLNNNKLLSAFDPLKEAGYCIATSKKSTIEIKGDEGLQIELAPIIGKTILNGIGITRKVN